MDFNALGSVQRPFSLDHEKQASLGRTVSNLFNNIFIDCVSLVRISPLLNTRHAFTLHSQLPWLGGAILILEKMKPGLKVRYEAEPGLKATSSLCPWVLLFLLFVTLLDIARSRGGEILVGHLMNHHSHGNCYLLARPCWTRNSIH